MLLYMCVDIYPFCHPMLTPQRACSSAPFLHFQLQLHVLGESLTHQISGCRKSSKKKEIPAECHAGEDMGDNAGYGDE